MKRDLLYTFLALAVLVLSMVPVGAAVFLLGFVYGDSPCVMCWEQRIGMAIIAILGLFILRYGPKPKYIGLSVLVGCWGVFMGMRHTGMHAARDVGQGFSVAILGTHTYTWALFIFWVGLVTMGVLLTVMKESDVSCGQRSLKALDKVAMVVFLVVIAGNIVQAFASTGPPPFAGQGDPIRFSFNPKHWVWSLDEWSSLPITLRGRWAVEKPAVAAASSDPVAGPLADLPVLAIKEQKRLTVPLRGTATDLAYDAGSDRFLLTTQSGVYLLDGTLSRILRNTIVDPGYSIDLGQFAGAAFLDSKTVMALGENKSFTILRENDGADANKNFRHFLESFDKFDEMSRSRLGTVRARMMYVMSLAFDPATNSLYTVTVPNSKVKKFVVSRFDKDDKTLSEEYTPRLAPDSGLKFSGKNRSLDDLYVTGAAISAGRMYAISAAHSTLLSIDLATRSVVAAHAIPGLVRPTGIAVRGGDFYIVGEGGEVFVISRP
jgi:disulfide bond formation protein DsbB